MDIVKKWFEEASRTVNVHKDFEGEFLIYKGFKLSKIEVKVKFGDNTRITYKYKAEDVRHSEFYSPLDLVEYGIMVSKGFIAGADHINHKLNLQRIDEYKKDIKALYEKSKIARRELRKGIDKKLNNKRIRLAKENIIELEDLIQLTESRIKQFNNKYNNNGSKKEIS